ncbi:hypothetical protein APHAL10511_000100 [Amanita phalloides]|nr:hypothetical protein APHAL10511_000100 [Amanita phalloides]
MLSFSQVDRTLRPLRNKSNALATFLSKSADVPPLSLIPPPDSDGSRIHFDKHRLSTLELSRRLYSVRDCFRDILAKILGKKIISKHRVVSLADLCATVVGSRLHEESDETRGSEEENPAIELLEAIPLQYRRKAVVAHSVELVLQLCPHHPSLLLLLLDVTLGYCLEIESYLLLRAWFTVACLPDTTLNPPLCHPAHQTLLVDLCKHWSSFGLTTSAFVGVLLSVVRTANSARVWTCKAMTTLVLQVAQDDISSFMTCVCELLHSLSDSETSPELYQILDRTLNIACEYLLCQDHPLDVDQIAVVLDHLSSLLEHNNELDIALVVSDAFVCLATHWLSQPPDNMSDQLARIELVLDSNKPKPTTYNALLSQITASGDLQNFKKSIQLYAAALRSHGLLHHEASLWSCALRQIEACPVEYMRNSAKSVQDFRLRLIGRVEEAENRCFGRQRQSPHHCSRPRRRSFDASATWSWDPILECWYRAHDGEPALKKPKTGSSLFFLDVRKALNIRQPLSYCSPPGSSPELETDDPLISVKCPSPRMNFATLLCRAISNRTVLHPEKQPYIAVNGHTTCHDESDDALDLFSHE